ncbi:unnamed protein product [Amoebophrya sp. A25]|nr:unnamed protein product [Amoebophrya sp. A25]|eukprot:GSA25T00010250001.1
MSSSTASSTSGTCAHQNKMVAQLLNEKFRVSSYDGGAFKSKSVYNIKNVLSPTPDVFHCSSSGTKYTAVFRCSDAVTVSNVVIEANLKKCTEPLKSILVWVLDEQPQVEKYAKYDNVPIDDLKACYGMSAAERKNNRDTVLKELNAKQASALGLSNSSSSANLAGPPPPAQGSSTGTASNSLLATIAVPKIGFSAPPFAGGQETTPTGAASGSTGAAQQEEASSSASNKKEEETGDAAQSGSGASSSAAAGGAEEEGNVTTSNHGAEGGAPGESSATSSLEAQAAPSSSSIEAAASTAAVVVEEEPAPALDVRGPYFFQTDKETREAELELAPWVEGKFVMIKFLDTWAEGSNVDVSVVGIFGFFGRHKEKSFPTGKVWNRSCRKHLVHPCTMNSMYSSNSWVCDGRDFPGGCRSGQTDFNQTSQYVVTFRALKTGVDLCERCARDPLLGQISEDVAKKDVDALLAGCSDRGDIGANDVAIAKLAAVRILTGVKRNWRYVLPFYLQAGVLEAMQRVFTKLDDITMALDEGNFRIVAASSASSKSRSREHGAGAADSNGSSGNGASSGGGAPKSSSSKRQQSSIESQKRILRQTLHSLLVELSHMVYFGFRGDLHPGDAVFFNKNTSATEQTGRENTGSGPTSKALEDQPSGAAKGDNERSAANEPSSGKSMIASFWGASSPKNATATTDSTTTSAADESKKNWVEGRFLGFTDNGEFAIIQAPDAVPPPKSSTGTSTSKKDASTDDRTKDKESGSSIASSIRVWPIWRLGSPDKNAGEEATTNTTCDASAAAAGSTSAGAAATGAAAGSASTTGSGENKTTSTSTTTGAAAGSTSTTTTGSSSTSMDHNTTSMTKTSSTAKPFPPFVGAKQLVRIHPSQVWKKINMVSPVQESGPYPTLYLADELAKGSRCSLEKVKELLPQADVMAANGQGCTLLFLAVMYQCDVEVLKLLVNEGAAAVEVCGLQEGISLFQLARQNYSTSTKNSTSTQELEEILKLLDSEERKNNGHAFKMPKLTKTNFGEDEMQMTSSTSSTRKVVDKDINENDEEMETFLASSSDNESVVSEDAGELSEESDDSVNAMSKIWAEGAEAGRNNKDINSGGQRGSKKRRAGANAAQDGGTKKSKKACGAAKSKGIAGTTPAGIGASSSNKQSGDLQEFTEDKKNSWHKLSLETLRAKFATRVLPVIHQVIQSYPLISGAHASIALRSHEGSGASMTQTLTTSEKLVNAVEFTWAGSYGPQLTASSTQILHGPADRTKLLSMLDQLPVEGLYALEPLLKSSVFYDALNCSRTAFSAFTKIIQSIVTTDSLEIAYHGCKFLNLIANHANFVDGGKITSKRLAGASSATESVKVVPSNTFAKLIRSHGAAKWAERIMEKSATIAWAVAKTAPPLVYASQGNSCSSCCSSTSSSVAVSTTTAETGFGGVDLRTGWIPPTLREDTPGSSSVGSSSMRGSYSAALMGLGGGYISEPSAPSASSTILTEQEQTNVASMLGFYRHAEPSRQRKFNLLVELRREAEKLTKVLAEADKPDLGTATGSGMEVDARALGNSFLGLSSVDVKMSGDNASEADKAATAMETSTNAGTSDTVSVSTLDALKSAAGGIGTQALSICGAENAGTPQIVSPFAKLNSIATASAEEIFDCFVELRQLLHDTRARRLGDGAKSFTSFELASVCAIPGSLVEVLQQKTENMAIFHEAFRNVEDFKRLTSFLHEVIDLGETFPVWRHKPDRGLRALTDMSSLRLARLQAPVDQEVLMSKDQSSATSPDATATGTTKDATSTSGSTSGGRASTSGNRALSAPSSPKSGVPKQAPLSPSRGSAAAASQLLPVDPEIFLPDSLRTQDFFVTVEPLVTIQEVSHYLQQISPIKDEKYLEYCYTLVGSVIVTRDVEYLVTDFSVYTGEIHLPVHTLQPLNVDKQPGALQAAALRAAVAKSPAAASPTTAEADSKSNEPVQMVLNLRQYEVLSLPEKAALEAPVCKFLAKLMALKVSMSTRDFIDAAMHLVEGFDATQLAETRSLQRKGSFGSLPTSPTDAAVSALTSAASKLVASVGSASSSGGNKFELNAYQVGLMTQLQDASGSVFATSKMEIDLTSIKDDDESGSRSTSKQALDMRVGELSEEQRSALKKKLIEELDSCRVYLEQRRPDRDQLNTSSRTGSKQVDPSQRCHTVFIVHTGGDDVPFDMIWGMLKDDITTAVRELCPRGSLQSEETLNAGIANNSGMGPLAKCLTLNEAERLASRVGNCVQTAVNVDYDEFAKIKNKEETALAAQAALKAPKRSSSPPSLSSVPSKKKRKKTRQGCAAQGCKCEKSSNARMQAASAKAGGAFSANSAHLSAGLRVQFASKPLRSSGPGATSSSSAKNKDPYDDKGVILSRSNNLMQKSTASTGPSNPAGLAAGAGSGEVLFDIINDDGVVFECLPKTRLKVSKSDMEKLNRGAPGGGSTTSTSAGGSSMMDLGPIIRLREQLGRAGAERALFGGSGSDFDPLAIMAGLSGGSSGGKGSSGAGPGSSEPDSTGAGKGSIFSSFKGSGKGSSSGKGFDHYQYLGFGSKDGKDGSKGAGKGHYFALPASMAGKLFGSAAAKGAEVYIKGGSGGAHRVIHSSSKGGSSSGPLSIAGVPPPNADDFEAFLASAGASSAAGAEGASSSNPAASGGAAAAASGENNKDESAGVSAPAAGESASAAAAPEGSSSGGDAAAPSADAAAPAAASSAAPAGEASSAAAGDSSNSGANAELSAAPAAFGPDASAAANNSSSGGAGSASAAAAGASAAAAGNNSSSAAGVAARDIWADGDDSEFNDEHDEDGEHDDDPYMDDDGGGYYGEGIEDEDVSDDENDHALFESILNNSTGRSESGAGGSGQGASGGAADPGASSSGNSRDLLLEQLRRMEEAFSGLRGRAAEADAAAESAREAVARAEGASAASRLGRSGGGPSRSLSSSLFSILGGDAPPHSSGRSQLRRLPFHGEEPGAAVMDPSSYYSHIYTSGRSTSSTREPQKRVGELPLRASLPGFTRTTEASDPRSTLEHPVAERVTQQELSQVLQEDAKALEDESKTAQRTQKNTSGNNAIVDSELLAALDSEFREVRATFCLYEPPVSGAPGTTVNSSRPSATTSSGGPASTNQHQSSTSNSAATGTMHRFPLRWNLFKVFQRLSDLQHYATLSSAGRVTSGISRNGDRDSHFPTKVNGLRRVPLDQWALKYHIEVQTPDLSDVPRLFTSMLDVRDPAERREMAQKLVEDLENEALLNENHPAKKRRLRMCQTEQELMDASLAVGSVARELYANEASLFGPERNHPFLLSTFCGNSEGVLDSLELLSILKTSYLKSYYNPGDYQLPAELVNYAATTPGGTRTTTTSCRTASTSAGGPRGGEDLISRPTGFSANDMRAKLDKHHNNARFWLNPKLDRKLRSQLDDPLSVITGALPWWVHTLARICPFLFSINTRKLLLKYTAFGQAFAIHWIQENKLGPYLKRRQTLQTELNAAAMDPRRTQTLSQDLSNVEEHIIRSNWWIGSLQAVLTKMEKNDQIVDIASMAMQRLNMFPSSCRTMEVQFENETGFGQAVTQSFYVELANRLIERDNNRKVPMWVEDDGTLRETSHVGQMCRGGLLVRPLNSEQVSAKVLNQFRFFGRLVAKALREGFIVPVPLSEEFFALVRDIDISSSSLPRPGTGYDGEFVGLMAEYVRDIARRTRNARTSEEKLRIMREEAGRKDFRERYLRKDMDSSPKRGPHGQEPCSFSDYCSDLGACFLETGFNGNPLIQDGDNIEITFENVESFVREATDFWFSRGISKQVTAFREGFNDVMPIQSLWTLSPKELMHMICGEEKIEWTQEQLEQHLHASGTLSSDHAVYKHLIEILMEMEFRDRQRFLDFVTSCPRLPPGGMAKMHIEVCGVAAGSTGAKSKLPYSRACSSQLYLPAALYSGKEDLRTNLNEAMYSSVGSHEHR